MIAPRTSDEITADISSRIPDGWAWDHSPGSNTMRSFAPLVDSVERFEQSAIALLEEAEPDMSEQMIADYERVLGPDTCLGDPSTLNLDERRTSVVQRWVGIGGASRAALVAMAAQYGVTITITELRRNCCGVLRCGRPLRGHPQQFTWVVGMPATTVRKFVCGRARIGEPLGRIMLNTTIECVIRRAAPEHTAVVFNYSGPLPAARWGVGGGWTVGGWAAP